MYNDLLKEMKAKSNEVIEKLLVEFKNVHTGRANSALVENIMVSYYGQMTPVKNMASINIPESNMILITPWDANALGDIETAVRNSEMGFNPVNDGRGIRISLPALTEERRNELIKMINGMREEAKIFIRTIRSDVWNEVKKMEKEGTLTEDDRYGAEEEINKITKEFNDLIDKHSDEKEVDLKKI